jgi:hypothetical protein
MSAAWLTRKKRSERRDVDVSRRDYSASQSRVNVSEPDARSHQRKTIVPASDASTVHDKNQPGFTLQDSLQRFIVFASNV